MRKLTIDFETRGSVNLKTSGLFKYAESPDTDIICISFKDSNALSPCVYYTEKFAALLPEGHRLPLVKDIGLLTRLFGLVDVIEAHNATFEMIMWREVMAKRRGMPDIPFNKVRCSAAKAAYYALPRSLSDVGSALNLNVQKDAAGYALMMKMCKPRKPTLADPSIWHEYPEDLARLGRYCIRDVETEEEMSGLLPDMPERELNSWRMDFNINNRGLMVDVEGIKNIRAKVEDSETKLILEIQELTKGFVKSARQIDNLKRWLADNGIDVDNLTKDTVTQTLKKDCPADVARVLEIRQLLGKSSVAKFEAMQDYTCQDNRMHGLFMWHGATTGRFSGKGPQLQNYPRESFKDREIEDVLAWDKETIEIWHCPIMQAASKCLRGMIVAPENKLLVAADFEQIEARVLAWLAREEKVLQQFRDKLPIYELAAADIYGKPYNKINKEERQIGKVCTLALGYQGWISALQNMATAYGIVLPSEDECKKIMTEWRMSRPATVHLWKDYEEAVMKTVSTGQPHSVGCIKFGIQDGFLRVLLPSGRKISYYQPRIDEVVTPYGGEKKSVTYMTQRAINKAGSTKWDRVPTYGGKLAENITQAVAADLLIDALKRVEASSKFKTVLHVHDEVVAEVDAGFKDLKEYEDLVAEVPEWAKGLPIAASGWIGKRYRK